MVRLVEQHQPRCALQRLHEADFLLHAVRVRANAPGQIGWGKLQPLEQLVAPDGRPARQLLRNPSVSAPDSAGQNVSSPGK